MKKLIAAVVVLFALSALMSSCFSHTFLIGEGPKTGIEVTEKNHFFIYGLVPGKVSDPQKMADRAEDFEITEVQTFVDGLVSCLTFGIYTPSTTIVQK